MRMWRILQIEDQDTTVKDNIYKSLFKDVLTYLIKDEDSIFKKTKESFSKINEHNEKWLRNVQIENGFPLLFGSLTDAYNGIKALSRQDVHPDIVLLDVKLVKNKSREDENIINEIRDFYLNGNLYRDENIAQQITEKFNYNILMKSSENEPSAVLFRGGLFLLPIIKKHFPDSDIIIYTESIHILFETLPFQTLKYFHIIPSGKSISKEGINWKTILRSKCQQYILEEKVDINKIKWVLYEYENEIERIGKLQKDPEGNMWAEDSLQLQDVFDDLVNTPIGKTEDGWTFGGFFILDLMDLGLNNTSPEMRKSAIQNIRDIYESIDYAKMFHDWVKDTSVSSFYYTSHDGYDGTDDALIEEIKVKISKHLLHSNTYSMSMFQKILENKDTLGYCKNLRDNIRLTASDIKNRLVVINPKDNEIKLQSWEFEIDDWSRELILPVDENEIPLVLDYVSSIFNNMDRAFEGIYLEKRCYCSLSAKKDQPYWEIKIRDNGRGFPIGQLKDSTFFDDNMHGLRKKLSKWKGWFNMEIQANNGREIYKRNPFSHYFTKYGEKESDLFDFDIIKNNGTLFIAKFSIFYPKIN